MVQHLEDASHGVVHEAVNQIAFADVILLNKIDLVTEEQLQHARDLVRCARARQADWMLIAAIPFELVTSRRWRFCERWQNTPAHP